MNKKERELDALEKTIAELSRVNVAVDFKWIKKRVTEEIGLLAELLNIDSERARAQLLRHVSEIRMQPTEEDGERFYIAEGEWLTGKRKRHRSLAQR